jgi:hypothetical protein
MDGEDEIWASEPVQDEVWEAKVVRRTKEMGGLRGFEEVKVRRVWY